MNSNQEHDTACMVLDVRMPGMNGLDLQHQMIAADWHILIIFITPHVDGEAVARAGAVDFLYKRFLTKSFSMQ